MTAPRPLTAIIGATENALRALLAVTVAPASIGGYEEWVTLTMVSGPTTPPSRGDLVRRLSTALKAEPARVNEVLDGLVDRHLLESGPTAILTAAGSAHLAAARTAVVTVTERVLAGIDDHDLAATARVLDGVRARAEQELSHH